MRVLVVLPTYNEAGNIEWIIRSLLALELPVDVLVVDDSSPDGTADIAKRAGPEDRITVTVRPCKMGMGSAQRAGMRAGVERGYDRVVVMDADGSHDPGTVPELVKAADTADVVIGSRYVKGGRIENWAFHRYFLSKGANTAARLALGRDIFDWTSSFRCYHVEALKGLPLDRFRSDGYAFAEEMLFEVRMHGFSTVEVPIVFVERRTGRSKIDRREILAAAWRLFAMSLKRMAVKTGLAGRTRVE